MRIELNVTLACNQSCSNCNRLCNLYKTRKEHMTPEQVDKMIGQLRQHKIIASRVKVAGGEPLLNPDFKEIYDLLAAAINEGLIHKVKIDSNGTLKYPPGLRLHTRIHRGGKVPGRKKHLPVFVAPTDMDSPVDFTCSVPRVCGYSLDAHGWLPCSAAIAIVRAFHLDDLYREDLPNKVWGLKEICHLCVMAMPREWKDQHAKPLSQQYILCTPRWRFALNDSDGSTTAPIY